jgi:5-formyltetrahydrofolate cyclo-ligase
MHVRAASSLSTPTAGDEVFGLWTVVLRDWRIAYGDRSRLSLIAVTRCGQVDLILCGSVAVNRGGARFGKGAGYPNNEVALLTDAD